jgi:hypothetical protein
MPASTPPKGRPTPGRRDRTVVVNRSRSRRRIIRYVWAVLAVAVLGALLVLGSGTGGNLDRSSSPGAARPLVPA